MWEEEYGSWKERARIGHTKLGHTHKKWMGLVVEQQKGEDGVTVMVQEEKYCITVGNFSTFRIHFVKDHPSASQKLKKIGRTFQTILQ